MKCRYCGKEISDTDNFCPGCGQPIHLSDYNYKNIYKEYAGVVKKCPNCGETINAFTLNCPTCGFEFRESQVSNSVSSFSKRLEEIESTREPGNDGTFCSTDSQVINLIKNYPVPSTREDIFEFVNFAASNIDVSLLDDDISNDNPRKAICMAWKSKLGQVFNKAIMVYDENDLQFQKIKRLYDSTQHRITTQQKKQKTAYTIGFILTIFGTIIALVLLLVGLIIGTLGDHSMDSSRANLLITFGDLILIISAFYSGKGSSGVVAPLGAAIGSLLAIIMSLVYPLIDKSYWGMVDSRSNIIMLAGIIALILAVINLIRKTSEKYSGKY